MHGALPTLIEWGDEHPTDGMPASGVELVSLKLRQRDPASLAAALVAAGAVNGIDVASGAPALDVVLETARGRVQLRSSP